MKIIKRGVVPILNTPEWIGRVYTCCFCDTEIKLEEGDDVTTVYKRDSNGERGITFKCPLCTMHLCYKTS